MVSSLIAVLAASACSSEETEAGDALSLLQTQVHRHNATIADVKDAPNADWPGYNFHDFVQSNCEKYGEEFGLQAVGARQKCSTKIITSTVDAFNKDLEAYGGCASGFPFTYSWQTKVATGNSNGLGRVNSFTSGDGAATEAVAESCRLAAEKDPRCAGANTYTVQKNFCYCHGGTIGVKAQDIGYYRSAGPYLTCNLKSMPAAKNPQDQTASMDGVAGELVSIKVTSTLQGCSKGWLTLNGGGISYNSGQVSGNEYVRLAESNAYRSPSDCAARIVELKNGATSRHTSDMRCKDAVGVRMHAAGAEATKGYQKYCGCLLPNWKASDYQTTGAGEKGGTPGGSLGSWVCLLDDGDVTKGVTYLPIPKKSGKYNADGPSPKSNLSPEEKAKCKADRSRLKAAKKEKKAAKAAFKAAKETVKAIIAEMEKC